MAKTTTKKTTKKTTKPAAKPSLDKRVGTDQGLLKRALRDPGLRSKLSDATLRKAGRTDLLTGRTLNAPVTPGSSMTNRELNTAATSAGQTAYGPKEAKLTEGLGIAQTQARDTGSFYDDYQRQLQAHAAAVQGYQAGAQAALTQTAQGITGLAGQQQNQLQQGADQAAQAQGTTTAANMAPTANAAEVARQSLMGSFQAQQGLNAASQNTYADTTANVVAPTQKLSAQAQGQQKVAAAQKKISDLAGERGAAEQKYKSETKADEAKTAAATAIAQGKTVAQLTETKLRLGADADKARATRKVDYAKIRADRKKAADKAVLDANNALDKRATSGPFQGLTERQIRALSPQQQTTAIDKYNKKKNKAKPGTPGGGPDWKTSEATSRGMTQLTSLKQYAQKAKRGEAFVAGHQPSGPLPRNGPNSASSKIQKSVAAPDDPILVTATLDAVYNGKLSASTVKGLIAAGYKPSRVMSALGVGSGQTPRAATTGAAGYNKGNRPG